MSHNNYTHNTNNNYKIEIVVDPSSGGGTGTTQMYDDNGTVYYKMDIFPNLASTPLFAGNFTIDGISPTYKWSYTINPYGLTGQSAPLPPHNYYTTQQIQKTILGQYGPLYPLDNNPIYGPIEFNNSTYVSGGFTTSGQRATWSKIILKEVYTDDAGVEYTANGQLQFQTSDEHLWHAGGLPNPNTFSATNGLPTKIVAYVYLELNQNVPAGNETLNIDFDETPPTGGCTDNLADNYSPNAHFDDGSCTYSPPSFSLPPLTTTSDLSSSTVYNVASMNGYQLNAPIDILILDNLTINIPSAINGLAPYDYEMSVADTVNASPSSSSSGPPAQIVIVDENASTFNNNTGTYDDIHFHFIPLVGNNTILGQTVEAGSFDFGKVVLQTDYTGGSITSDVINDITVTVTADDDNGDQDTSTISLNMTTYYPFI